MVVGTGPSLNAEQAAQCMFACPRIIAVNDAYRLFPFADILYACDSKWWIAHKGVPSFQGQKWSSHDNGRNAKLELANEYDLRLVWGEHFEGFSRDPNLIHYGRNSGFQAVNLAIHFGCNRIVLLGFTMLHQFGAHFFGDHPPGYDLKRDTDHSAFPKHFDKAVQMGTVPPGVRIVNATSPTGLACFPHMSLKDALCL